METSSGYTYRMFNACTFFYGLFFSDCQKFATQQKPKWISFDVRIKISPANAGLFQQNTIVKFSPCEWISTRERFFVYALTATNGFVACCWEPKAWIYANAAPVNNTNEWWRFVHPPIWFCFNYAICFIPRLQCKSNKLSNCRNRSADNWAQFIACWSCG